MAVEKLDITITDAQDAHGSQETSTAAVELLEDMPRVKCANCDGNQIGNYRERIVRKSICGVNSILTKMARYHRMNSAWHSMYLNLTPQAEMMSVTQQFFLLSIRRLLSKTD